MINGEVTATYRKGFKQTTPVGMVPIPSGSFIMGQTDQDIAATMSNFNKRVTIMAFFMDDTEITNHEYRQFTNALLTDSISVLGEDVIMKEYYPDTTVWKRDFTYTNGDPMVEYYFQHPAFDTYPVVGVSWIAANYFSKWRSNIYNEYRAQEGLMPSPEFKLPTEAEWEWAARGGRAGAKYPWGNPTQSTPKVVIWQTSNHSAGIMTPTVILILPLLMRIILMILAYIIWRGMSRSGRWTPMLITPMP